MNKKLLPPSPNSKVGELPVHNDGRVSTSVWLLDDEAMEWVIKNRCIVLQVFAGTTQPPVAITELREELEPQKPA